METSNSGAESSSHVAQQSRRDKLRIQQRLQDFSNNLDQQSEPSLAHNQVRNLIRSSSNANNLVFQSTTNSNAFSTYEILNFAINSNANMVYDDENDDQELGVSSVQPHRPIVEVGQDSSFAMSHPILSNFTCSPKTSATTSHDPHGCCGNWRSLEGSHQTGYDWMMNYGSVGGVGEVMSSDARVVSNGSYQDVHVQSVGLANHLSGISGHDGHKQFRDMQFGSHHRIYHDNLLDVPSTSFGCNDQRTNFFSYGNQSTATAALQLDHSANAWMNRPVENSHQWSGELGFVERKCDHNLRPIACDPNTQSLSLSLSSNPSSDVNAIQFGEGYESENLHSKAGGAVLKEDLRVANSSSYMFPMEKPSIISKSSGKSLQDIVGSSACAFRSTGPLGPFTGYATILKSSRFLKPAQELLEELCRATCSKILRSNGEISERVSVDQASVSTLADVVNPTDMENVGRGNHDSGMYSSNYSFNEGGNGDGRDGSGSSCEPYKPEYQQKKAKLLYMQEEVCRRYKQYQQQMQMVASSFESVAGLSTATPYVSLALKTVSRNFRCLRNAISDQLKHVTKALGEDLLLTNAIESSSRGDTSTTRFRYMDQSFQKQKYGGANVGCFETQQHVWRPQRGLPERSVAILRAWLFDHFLHPYPTDTDKHMLATQTGLSRNQVSNWFINARVRVWKPMVEEIHMLESKGLAETNRNSTKNYVNSAEDTGQPTGSREHMDEEQWNQERKSNEEFQVPTGMDGSLLNFLPFQRNTIDVGGLGAVSLTLGLRHGVENSSQQQQQQQFQQHEDQLRRQFGGQMIHDFVG